MTDDMMALRRLMEKSADADLLREMISFAAQRLMDGAGAARVMRWTFAHLVAHGDGRPAVRQLAGVGRENMISANQRAALGT